MGFVVVRNCTCNGLRSDRRPLDVCELSKDMQACYSCWQRFGAVDPSRLLIPSGSTGLTFVCSVVRSSRTRILTSAENVVCAIATSTPSVRMPLPPKRKDGRAIMTTPTMQKGIPASTVLRVSNAGHVTKV